ncbi:MAG TPA: DUF3467 domain-containing protein [Candidatus Dormibacteraeota bacterium]|jgi:hypothetical protein|nr:DUF3467 domain-containing protein [Candidatus Dormibacteraeota bacterium]
MPEADVPSSDVAAPSEINVQIPEPHFDILYSDQAFISHTPVGFTLDFAQLTPQAGLSRVVARVGMSPLHLKLLVRVLSDNLKRDEAEFGEVSVTKEMMEQHQARAHHIGFQPDPNEPKK